MGVGHVFSARKHMVECHEQRRRQKGWSRVEPSISCKSISWATLKERKKAELG